MTRGPWLLCALLAVVVLVAVGSAGVRLRPYWVAKYRGERADLHGAMLIRAPLQGADLSGANLCGADLSGADLSRAEMGAAATDRSPLGWPLVTDLTGAALRGATLRGANLAMADLTRGGPAGRRARGRAG